MVIPRFRGDPNVSGQDLGFVKVAFLLVEVGLSVAVQIRPDEPANISSVVAVEVCHSPQSVCANDDAPENISFILVTWDTSHLEMSPLNDEA